VRRARALAVKGRREAYESRLDRWSAVSIPKAQIVVIAEGESKRAVDIGALCTVGRSSKSDLVIDHLDCSRRHAEFRRRTDGSIELVDLGSRNGCFVNGVRIQGAAELRDGDRIDIAEVILRFTLVSNSVAEPDAIAAGEPSSQLSQDLCDALDVSDPLEWDSAAELLGQETEPDLLGSSSSDSAVAELPAVVVAATVVADATSASPAAGEAVRGFRCDWETDARRVVERGGGACLAASAVPAEGSLVAYWLLDQPEEPGPEIRHVLRATVSLCALAAEVEPMVSATLGGGRFRVRLGVELGGVRLESVRRSPDGAGWQVSGRALELASALRNVAVQRSESVLIGEEVLAALPDLDPWVTPLAEHPSTPNQPGPAFALDLGAVRAWIQ